MDDQSKIVIEQHGNRDVRGYHLTAEVSRAPYENFRRPLRDASDRYLSRVGDSGRELVEKLISISGVEGVEIRPYQITVSKGTAFDWSNVQSKVLDTLKTAFEIPADEVIVEDLDVPSDVASA